MSILSYLEEFRRTAKSCTAACPNTTTEGNFQDILTLPLTEFAKRNTALKVRSRVLGEDVYFISNPKCFQLVDGDYVTYLPYELEILIKLNAPPETIRKIHQTKKILGARLERGQRIE